MVGDARHFRERDHREGSREGFRTGTFHLPHKGVRQRRRHPPRRGCVHEAYQKTKDGEFHIEAQGVRDSLYIRSVFGKEIPEAMQNDLRERGSAGPLELNGRQQFLAVNPYTKAVLAKGGVVKDVELEYNCQKRTGTFTSTPSGSACWLWTRTSPRRLVPRRRSPRTRLRRRNRRLFRSRRRVKRRAVAFICSVCRPCFLRGGESPFPLFHFTYSNHLWKRTDKP